MSDTGGTGRVLLSALLAAAIGASTQAFPDPARKPAPAQSRAARKSAPVLRLSRSTPLPRPLPPGGARVLVEEAPRYTGEPISLDLKDADIKDVLLTFSKLTGLNMVIDPDVKGSVTVRLENVPWDQALDVILKVNGLGYVLEGNILRVGTPQRLQAAPAIPQ